MAKKRGRPPKDPTELAESRIELRLLPADKTAWVEAAERAQQPLSAWIRDRLNRAAKRESKRD